MTQEYYPLPGMAEINKDGLKLPRAQSLHDAVDRHRSFKHLGVLQQDAGGMPQAECLVVEVELHGVPVGNTAGIDFRERLALLVPPDKGELVSVLALRKNFPNLMHLNGVPAGTPASLCLHFGPIPAVLRTWTAERFLDRILWWINESAAGTLHVADQPLEGLFFSTRYELLLPWDFNSSNGLAGHVIGVGPARHDEGRTFVLNKAGDAAVAGISVSALELQLPAVQNGRVESHPETLGQLADLLQERGVDLIATLKARLVLEIDNLPGKAAPLASDTQWSVLLLYVPMSRHEGGEAEAVLRRAFFVKHGRLSLGRLLGALVAHNGSVYIDHMGQIDASAHAAWRSENVFALELLRANSREAARKQSGIAEEGPVGLMLGVGTLGGALIELWNRSGWGQWTAIDKDHIRPHNLSRHGAAYAHVGLSKADVAAMMAQDVTHGANPVKSLVADVLQEGAEAVHAAAAGADLIVDVTTTIDYPRLASTRLDLPRHVSTYLTPDGSSAVLMVEDKERKTSLMSLEAQYYRELLEADWGATHLQGHLGSFWSGAGCRDVSAVLPYARILTHAGNLAEQIRAVQGEADAAITIWTRHANGSVEHRRLEVAKQIAIGGPHLTVYLDAGLLAQLRQLRTEAAPRETGGVLLGYFDFNVNAVVLVQGTTAPSDSVATETSFVRGKQGVLDLVMEAKRRTAGIVGYIGEWHCHPPGHSAVPSTTDFVQLAMTSTGMAEEGLPAVTLIVGGDDYQVMVGQASYRL